MPAQPAIAGHRTFVGPGAGGGDGGGENDSCVIQGTYSLHIGPDQVLHLSWIRTTDTYPSLDALYFHIVTGDTPYIFWAETATADAWVGIATGFGFNGTYQFGLLETGILNMDVDPGGVLHGEQGPGIYRVE
jgi:hypothetical protein